MTCEVHTDEETVCVKTGEPGTARGAREVTPRSLLLRRPVIGVELERREAKSHSGCRARSGNSGVTVHSREPRKGSHGG